MCMEVRKRAMSLFLAIIMTMSMGILPLNANAAESANGDPWKDSAAWPALTGRASTLAPDAVKFTHKEYTGENYNDPSGNSVRACDVTAVNREDPHTTATVPYDSVESAVNGAVNYQKDSSAYVQMLTGDNNKWDLTVVQNAAMAQKFLDHRFMDSNYQEDPNDGWKKVDLPASWTSYGFDFPIYTNVQYPWQSKYDPSVTCPNAPVNYNPVGLYVKKFTLKDTMLQGNGRVFINFSGVESAYYVYVNGHEVGYSEDSYMAHEFDITDYLNPKGQENTLGVEVHKFCDGTYFEDQDMIYDGGIFRDVYLKSTPLIHINDYQVVTDLDDTFTDATLKLATKVKNYSAQDVSNYGIDIKLFDADGKNIFENDPMRLDVSSIGSGKTAEDNISKLVKNPKLWSAEHPYLYTLVLSLYDKTSGKYFESTSQELGFREIDFTRSTVDANYKNTTPGTYKNITINGKPLLFKGVNRHDSDPFYGKHVTKEDCNQDIIVMKKNNINAIRTSHYGNDEYLYYLCDKYGMYMMGETNLECHGINGDQATVGKYFTDLCMDRTATSFNSLKNRTAIVMWSIGNEMGYTVNGANNLYPKMIWYFKDRDTTRPVHSEGQGSEGGVDVASNMYPSVETVATKAKTANQMPYVLCEYNHAMGNAVGNMNEYWNAIRSSTNMMGGFIWDWVEQSRAISFDKLPDQFSMTEKSNNTAVATVYGDGKTNDATAESLTGKSYSGYTLMPTSKNDLYNSTLCGKAFTYEVMVKPASKALNSVFIAKGDNQAALKTKSSGDGIEFFVKSGDSWISTGTDSFPSDWVGNWHQIVGTYDQTGLKLYYDGVLQNSNLGTYSVNSTSDQLGIGYDVTHGRNVDGEISVARIYSKALTLDEIKAQRSAAPAITEKDPSVTTWLDYSAGITKLPKEVWDYYATKESHQNTYKGKMNGHYYGYGGDWGDRPNDNDFCVNGLVSPDRDPQPEINEVKYEYQNFWITAADYDILNRKVKIYNENNFANLNEYNLDWELVEDGKVIDNGTVANASLAPKGTDSFSIPYTMPAIADRKAGSEYYLNINVTLKDNKFWADAGYEVAHKQFKVAATVPAVAPTISTNAVNIDQTSDTNDILVTGTDFSFKLNKTTGAMSNYKYKGEEIISQGPVPNFWRAKNDNDKYMDGNWQSMNKNIKVDTNGITFAKATDGRQVITTNLILNNNADAKETMVYTIDGSGAVTVNLKLDAMKSSLGQMLKFGSTMTVPEGYENFKWYGLGEAESYVDRKDFAINGVFSTTVNNLFYPFLLTQTSGNMSDVKWVSLTGDNKQTGILVAGKDLLETSAQHFTMDELDATAHPYELKAPHKETFFNVDYKSRGIGNATCGDDTLPKYRLPNANYSYEYTIIPYDKTKDPMELSKPWRTITAFDEDAVSKQQIAKVQAEIDGLFVYSYDQLSILQQCEADYNELSDSQKAQITNYSKVEYALNHIESLNGKSQYIADKSKNKLDPVLGTATTLKRDATFGVSMSGYMAIPNTKGTSGGDIFSDVIKGKKPFTVETWIKPSSITSQNMIMGKGDSCFGLRADSQSLDFFYTSANGSWPGVYVKSMPADWVNKWHQVAGIYDGTTLSFYLDGAVIGKGTDTGTGFVPNKTDFNIGYDPETSRGNVNEFAVSRVYSKALTAAELQKQAEYDKDSTATPAYAPTDSNVVMWLDYKNLGYDAATEKDEIQKVSITPDKVDVCKGASKQFSADVDGTGYFAKNVKWSVNSKVSTISSTGLLTVAPNEAAATLIVTATSTADSTKSGTATVTVTSVPSSEKTVTAFENLAASIKTQKVANGTILTSKNLPDTLKATVDGKTESISSITWSSNPTYNATVSGIYTMTAKLPNGYVLGNKVSMPTIIVVVAAGENDNSGHHSSDNSSSSKTNNDTQPGNATTTQTAAGGTVTTVSTQPDTTPIVTGNKSNVAVTVPADVAAVMSAATKDKPAEVKVSAPTASLVEQLKNTAVTTVDLTVSVPSVVANNTNANAKVSINVEPAVLQAAKDAKKDVTVEVVNSATGNMAYSWTFTGANLKNSAASLTNVNLAITVEPAKNDTTAAAVTAANTSDRKPAGLVLNFAHNGLLPATASVRVYVGNQPGVTPFCKMYMYYLNKITNTLEQLPQSEYTVDALGVVTVPIAHCSEYVLLPKPATNAYAVKSDTWTTVGVKGGKTYTYAMTVSGKAVPSFTVGNSKAFAVTVKHVGNKYYVTVRATGTAGTMTAVYSTLPKQKPIIMGYAAVVK